MDLLKTFLVLSRSSDQLNRALESLSGRGVTVRRVEGLYRFVATFCSAPADGVIADLEGWRWQDLEVLQVVRELRPHVGIVALAGSEQRELAAAALCTGADLYLIKPVHGPELLEAVQRAGLRRRLAEMERGGLARADALARLALGVAHEVNNPLTTISGWLQMLITDRAGDAQLAGVLRSMKEESDRIAEVVRQLLAFAQQGPPRAEAVDVARLLGEMERLYSVRCRSKGIELVTELAPNLPAVAGDAEQLRQACDAILDQSETALNGAGKIHITGQPKGEGVEIVFRDNGPAIPKDTLDRLFEPFHPGRRRDAKGLGLCVAYGIVRSHGGRMEAESDESAGTRFTLWLPCKR